LNLRAVWQHSLECCEATHLDPNQYVETVIDFVLRGVAARPFGIEGSD